MNEKEGMEKDKGTHIVQYLKQYQEAVKNVVNHYKKS
jgi:hypothetical protein